MESTLSTICHSDIVACCFRIAACVCHAVDSTNWIGLEAVYVASGRPGSSLGFAGRWPHISRADIRGKEKKREDGYGH